MAKKQNTFAKRQRETDKRQKAERKRQRRQMRKDEPSAASQPTEMPRPADQA